MAAPLASRSPSETLPPLTIAPQTASPAPIPKTVDVVSQAKASVELPAGATRSTSEYSIADAGAIATPERTTKIAIDGIDHAAASGRNPAAITQKAIA